MTIITYRHGIMASDDLLWSTGGYIIGRQKKIAWRKKDGALIAAAGRGALGDKFINLALKGKTLPKDNGTDGDGATGIIVHKDGRCLEYDGDAFLTINADFYAIGMGADIAIGAMMAGQNAVEAAASACRAHSWNSGIHAVDHQGNWFYVHPDDVSSRIIHANHVPKPE